MTGTEIRTALAVLGSPIAHSKSPRLHEAAYRVLGLPFTYRAIDISSGQLPLFVASRDESWRGLSLTMPLKRDILPHLVRQDALVTLSGGANTALFTDEGIVGFNTDVYGVTEALRRHGVTTVGHAQVLGSGATASSVIIAIAGLGARTLVVSTRSPQKAAPLVELAGRLGLTIAVHPLEADSREPPDLVVSTLPGGTVFETPLGHRVTANATLLDVAYDPWPTPLAARFAEAGGRVVSGLEMLLFQALAQVRVFVNGSAEVPLRREPAVLQAMAESVDLRL